MMGHLIPDRKIDALSGSEFAKVNLNNKYDIIDQNILVEALSGNIPNFIKNFTSISIQEKNDKLTYLVMPDVFCLGHDNDFIRVPMSPLVAKKIADQYNCVLPTKKMCDQIWKAATIKVAPIPKGAPYDNSMLSMDTFVWHNKKIESQLVNKKLGELISGTKKDVVIDKVLLNKTDKVAIYGWFKLDGSAIQGPTVNSSSHDHHYFDYSHGIRFIARDVILNGQVHDIYEILNSNYSYLISEQGSFNATTIYR